MTPGDVSTIQAALLALLTAILAALAPIVAVRVNAWLDTLAKNTQLSGAADLAHSIVRGVEQQYGSANGAAKKQAAVGALQAALPWLPDGVAGVLVEAGVQALNSLQAFQSAPAALVASATPLDPATPQAVAPPVQRVEIHVMAPPPSPPAPEPAAPAIALPPGSAATPSALVGGSSVVPAPATNGTAAPEVTATISPI